MANIVSLNITREKFVISLKNNSEAMLKRMLTKTPAFWMEAMYKSGIILTNEDVDFIKQKLAEHVAAKDFDDRLSKELEESGYVDEVYKIFKI